MNLGTKNFIKIFRTILFFFHLSDNEDEVWGGTSGSLAVSKSKIT